MKLRELTLNEMAASGGGASPGGPSGPSGPPSSPPGATVPTLASTARVGARPPGGGHGLSQQGDLAVGKGGIFLGHQQAQEPHNYDAESQVGQGLEWPKAAGATQTTNVKRDEVEMPGQEHHVAGHHDDSHGDGVSESTLREFATGGGDGDSGQWYTDDELADIIGDDWFEDFDVSNDGFNIDAYGEKAKKNLVGYANSWFNDKGYNVNVMGVEHNDVDHDLKWYIVGSFQNDNFAKKDLEEIDRRGFLKGLGAAAVAGAAGKAGAQFVPARLDTDYAPWAKPAVKKDTEQKPSAKLDPQPEKKKTDSEPAQVNTPAKGEEYAKKITKIINSLPAPKEPKNYPYGFPGTRIELRMDSDGTILSRNIVSSSGSLEWDEWALAKISNLKEFPKDEDGSVLRAIRFNFKPHPTKESVGKGVAEDHVMEDGEGSASAGATTSADIAVVAYPMARGRTRREKRRNARRAVGQRYTPGPAGVGTGVFEASLATMRDYFAGNDNAHDTSDLTLMRNYFSKIDKDIPETIQRILWKVKNNVSLKPMEYSQYKTWMQNRRKMKEAHVLDHQNVIYRLDKDKPMTDTEVLVLGGAGRYTLGGLRDKARREAEAMAADLKVEHGGSFRRASENIKQLTNTLNTIVAAYNELARIRRKGGRGSRGITDEESNFVRECTQRMTTLELYTHRVKQAQRIVEGIHHYLAEDKMSHEQASIIKGMFHLNTDPGYGFYRYAIHVAGNQGGDKVVLGPNAGPFAYAYTKEEEKMIKDAVKAITGSEPIELTGGKSKEPDFVNKNSTVPSIDWKKVK